MNRLASLKKEKKINVIAESAYMAFLQLETEEEFIEAMSGEIKNSNVASILWHTLNKLNNDRAI